MSVVDQCGFITNVLKCFHFGVPLRSFLESSGCFKLPFHVTCQLDRVVEGEEGGLGVVRLQSAFEFQHTHVCREAMLGRESDCLHYASNA